MSTTNVFPMTPLPAPGVCSNSCPPWLGPQGDSITCVPFLPSPTGNPFYATYTGNGTTQDIILGFDPAVVFIKNNVTSENWMFQAISMPINMILRPDTNATRFLRPNYITSFTIPGGGFSIANGPDDTSGLPEINTPGETYTVWAFPEYPGLCVTGTYMGDNTAFQTIPHSLSVIPEFIITKETTSSSNWEIYHKDMLENNVAYLNAPYPTFIPFTATPTSTSWGQTPPTATHFAVGGSNNLPVEHVFIAFATFSGACKVGSYLSDGSAVSIPVDFIPSQIMLKNAFQAPTSGRWMNLDRLNNPTNPITKELSMTVPDPVATITPDIGNFYNDRIEIISTDMEYNQPGDTYVYIAWGY